MRRTKTTWRGAAFCAALLLSAAPAIADAQDSHPPEVQRSAAAADGEFVTQALAVNELELVLGRLAVERASSPDVKAMGATMVQKHSALGQELKELAQRSGVRPAPELSEAQRDTVARLSSLTGTEFDQTFKTVVDAGHVDELAMYRQEAGQARDPRLAALAQRRVATLEKQVAQASSRSDRATAAKHDSDW
jgi:putative membrane protein